MTLFLSFNFVGMTTFIDIIQTFIQIIKFTVFGDFRKMRAFAVLIFPFPCFNNLSLIFEVFLLPLISGRECILAF